MFHIYVSIAVILDILNWNSFCPMIKLYSIFLKCLLLWVSCLCYCTLVLPTIQI